MPDVASGDMYRHDSFFCCHNPPGLSLSQGECYLSISLGRSGPRPTAIPRNSPYPTSERKANTAMAYGQQIQVD